MKPTAIRRVCFHIPAIGVRAQSEPTCYARGDCADLTERQLVALNKSNGRPPGKWYTVIEYECEDCGKRFRPGGWPGHVRNHMQHDLRGAA